MSSAQRERLLCEEEDPRDSRNVIYCGYCSTHHKKMVCIAGGGGFQLLTALVCFVVFNFASRLKSRSLVPRLGSLVAKQPSHKF